MSVLCEVCNAMQIAYFANSFLEISTEHIVRTNDPNILIILLSIIKRCLQIGVGPSNLNKYAIQFESKGGVLILNKLCNHNNEIIFKEVNKIKNMFYDKPVDPSNDMV